MSLSFAEAAELWRRTIWAITSVFESGRPDGNPKAFQNVDAGIISYGKHQATLAAGSLAAVLEKFIQRSNSLASQALRDEFLVRVQQKDAQLRNNSRLKELLLQAGDEPEMNVAQEEVFASRYYQPAVLFAQQIGVKTALGLACLYDTKIQGGMLTVTERVANRLGSDQVTDEAVWIRTFLNEREAYLLQLSDKAQAQGDQLQADALRISTFRVRELRQLSDAGNLHLTGQFLIRGQGINGVDQTSLFDDTASPHQAKFVQFNTPDNLDILIEGKPFTVVWRMKNTGTTVWGNGTKVVSINSPANPPMSNQTVFALADVGSRATVLPNQEVDITLRMTALAANHRHESHWQLQDDQGRRFGQTFFVWVIPQKDPNAGISLLKNDAELVSHPDGEEMKATPGLPLIKRWLVKNSGEKKWNNGYRLVFQGGDAGMVQAFSQIVPEARIGDQVALIVSLVAPSQARSEPYISQWRLTDDKGQAFGDTLTAKVQVNDPARLTFPLPVVPLSQNDLRWKNSLLGQSNRTIGEFGCFLTCVAMILNAYGENLTPSEANNRFLQLPSGANGTGFNRDTLFFNAPVAAFDHIRNDGNFKPFQNTGATFADFDPNLLDHLNQHLITGGLALLQVDKTPAAAYNPNVDQHWVFVQVGNGNDYQIVDPLDGGVKSLVASYGQPGSGQSPTDKLKNSIKSALLYSSSRTTALPDPTEPPTYSWQDVINAGTIVAIRHKLTDELQLLNQAKVWTSFNQGLRNQPYSGPAIAHWPIDFQLRQELLALLKFNSTQLVNLVIEAMNLRDQQKQKELAKGQWGSIVGIHGAPGIAAPPPQHWNLWVSHLKEMGVRWYKQCDNGDPNDTGAQSVFAWANRLKQEGIEPIIRYLMSEQFPDGLPNAFFEKMKKYANAGILWAEIGNEPNLDGEWKSQWRNNDQNKSFRHDNADLTQRIAETWIGDAQKALNAGVKPAFYAFAPTDWRGGVNPFYSSVQFTRNVIRYLAQNRRAETLEIFRRGGWIAVHAATYEQPLNFDPFNNGPAIWDMTLRSYELPLRAFREFFGVDLDVDNLVVMSTEGGVFTPDSTSMNGHERLHTNEEHAQKVVEMFDWLQQNSPLQAMCPWCISVGNFIGHFHEPFRFDGWFEEVNGQLRPRAVFEAVRQLRFNNQRRNEQGDPLHSQLKLAVPFISQNDPTSSPKLDCGPTCVVMILNAGKPATQHLTVDQLYAEHLPGHNDVTSISQNVTILRDEGVGARGVVFNNSTEALTELKKFLQAGRPVVILVNYAKWNDVTKNGWNGGHFVVATGFDQDHIFVHDPLFSGARRHEGQYFVWRNQKFLDGWGSGPEVGNPPGFHAFVVDKQVAIL